jgi:predicted glutamine amidotransferase
MCRMFAYVGDSPDDLESLFTALKQASSCDPCLIAMRPEETGQHKHGWGYVLRASERLFHYRTHLPVYEDKHRLPETTGEIQAIFHVRLSSGPVVGDAIFSHPYMAVTDRTVIFFAHNGSMRADLSNIPNKVDSEWALDQIVKAGGVAQSLALLREHTKSALNLLTLAIDRDKRSAAISYINYYRDRGDAKKDGYYAMYKATMSSGGRAVFSSTLLPLLIEGVDQSSKMAVEFDELKEL